MPMKVMILAAGRGERLRPLTNHTPKPLLAVAGRAMIEYTIDNLVTAGFQDIVINLSHLGAQIRNHLGDGKQFGANICYSDEGDNALETAGGIQKALPLLGDQAFVVINGDIATDFDYARLHDINIKLAHLILIPNPEHHQQGDFGLNDGIVDQHSSERYTFSGIGIYHPDLFKHCQPGKLRLADLLREVMGSGQVSGTLFTGFWMDVGTPERLQTLNNYYITKR
jgi:MurNAc alpha-1-phosphate uridylyltransferase